MKTTNAHRRPTRLMSLLAALAMIASLAVVQAAPAFASAPGWARLVAGGTVLPGSSQYGIQVETQATPAGFITVGVPSGIGLDVTEALSVTDTSGNDLGFTGTVFDVGGTFQQVVFNGGTVPANSNAVLRFNADIDPPATATERQGTFTVEMAEDASSSSERAEEGQRDPRGGGTLTTVIKFLEVFDVTVTGPSGVTDLTGTEGQDIAVRTSIRNYANVPVQVQADLASSSPRNYNANEQISDPVTLEVLGGGTATADFDVTLGTAERQTDTGSVDEDRPVTFSGSVVEPVTGSTGFSASTDQFTVQVLGRISFDGSTFGPRIVAPGVKTFSMNATHTGTPAFDVALGGAEVAFADTTATTQVATSYAPDAESQVVEFTGQVTGDDGDHPVSVSYMATDENGYTYFETLALTEPGLFGRVPVEVTIDALAPEITAAISLPDDADGRQQTAAKDGDSISVSGSIDDADATIREVRLVANGSIIAKVTTDQISRSAFGDGYSASFDDVQFPSTLDIGQFQAVAIAADEAGNVGVGFSGAVDFDNIIPKLFSARVESTIDVQNELLATASTDASVISVRFDENGLVRGGCNPNQYAVDGQNIVREVRYADNTPCFSGQAGPDNDRLLILSVPIDRDATPAVRYSPIPGDRIGDFAGNLAPEDTVTATSGIVPAAPDLQEVYRNTSGATPDQCEADESACEDAYQEGTGSSAVYWTRFDGNDTVVCVAGARAGYSVEATDANGNAIVGTRVPTSDTTPCLRVPIGSEDETYVRGVRFVNSAGAGDIVYLNIALDTVDPTISNVVRSGDEIEVSFDDVLVEGDNAPSHWIVYEVLNDGTRVATQADAVRTPGDALSSDESKRVLTNDFDDNGDFLGIGYQVRFAERYADRGGNLLADDTGPIS